MINEQRSRRFFIKLLYPAQPLHVASLDVQPAPFDPDDRFTAIRHRTALTWLAPGPRLCRSSSRSIE